MKSISRCVVAGCFAVIAATTKADQVDIAVASNFTAPLAPIVALFERETGHTVRMSLGATGKFYTQIVNGAPFDVLLSGDSDTPARLIMEGYGVGGCTYTYAIGRLVLWSANPGLVYKHGNENGDILERRDFHHLAVANPKTAPYGIAAQRVMERMGLFERLQPLFVQGENIAQTYQFVASGAADLGFVAYSQVIKDGKISTGSGWLVPAHLHDPIRQDAVLLTRGKDNRAAKDFLHMLTSAPVQEIIRSFGYDVH